MQKINPKHNPGEALFANGDREWPTSAYHNVVQDQVDAWVKVKVLPGKVIPSVTPYYSAVLLDDH